MFMPDFSNTGFLYEERLREAEQHRIHNKRVQSALAYARAHGQVSFLSQLAQRLHIVKLQQTDVSDKRDTRQMHAV